MAKNIGKFTVRSGDQEVNCTIFGLQRNDKVIFYASYTIHKKSVKNSIREQGPFEIFQPWDGIVLSQFKEYVEELIHDRLSIQVDSLV